jgi:hypothetical protein
VFSPLSGFGETLAAISPLSWFADIVLLLVMGFPKFVLHIAIARSLLLYL